MATNKKAKTKGLTPMMQQYLSVKEENPDCLLFFRLGDFYELFFEDAITASQELEIALTGRDCGLEERAPMCGVPYHAADSYLKRLVEKGYKVAICEQLSDPKDSVGIVERGIIRIVTPGTLTEEDMLQSDQNNFIVALSEESQRFGFAYADISTGEFALTEFSNTGQQSLLEELSRIRPSEIVIAPEFAQTHEALIELLEKTAYVSIYADWAYENKTAERNLCTHLNVASLSGFGCDEMIAGISAAGALLAYINETQKNALLQINRIKSYRRENHMILDSSTRRNLELTETLRGGSNKKGTLLGLLDRTKTAMGARLLRQWVQQPLYKKAQIEKRQAAVEEFSKQRMLSDTLREQLRAVHDLERLAGRISGGSFHARDAVSLEKSLEKLPDICQEITLCRSEALQEISNDLDPLADVCDLLSRAMIDEPPLSLKEGNLIRDGYNEEVDRLRKAATQGKNWLRDLEERERQSTGIKNLRIGYNRVFGYYIEVTKSYLDKVPYRYQRKQTLANAERFFTQELKELETQILGAEDKLVALEYEMFCALRTILEEQISRIQSTARTVASLDVYTALADVALECDYVKPEIVENGALEIYEGRHPVVERSEKGRFVANDTMLSDEERLLIITGPNMAGKSTYLRQVALIVLMAQIGSFVPARSARIPLTDRIFTRVGASDDLASGKSTFMVEMSETANILQNATSRSLLLMDEIGRGTSTFDGLSIAWAVCEYIADPQTCGAKTLFATHYHELSELEGILPGVANVRITVKEMGEDIVFLRKIVRGGSDKSFGIQVARLAGLPQEVIKRAKEILARLEQADLNHPRPSPADEQKQTDLFSFVPAATSQALATLAWLDIDSLSPREALDQLYQLQNLARQEK